MFWRKKPTMPQNKKKPSQAESAPKAVGPARSKGTLLSLESRLMFDAAAAATAAEVNQEQVAQEQAESAVSAEGSGEPTAVENESQELLQAIATYNPGESRTEIAFVDPTVPDYQHMIAGMGPNVEVVVLDGTRDGMEQIAESLAGRSGVDAIHLISHGSAGELQLGTGTLTAESMSSEYADEFATIRGTLSDQADILVYGCNFGEGAEGGDAVNLLAELTGADVAASSDQTGHIDLGGDWEFEVQAGSIETDVALTDTAQMNWAGILGTETVRDTFSSTSYSNNNGTQTWSTSWTETDASGGGASGGDVRVNSSQLRIDTDTVGNAISRGVNLTNATSATLTFNYTNSLTGSDRIELRVSTDGGANYQTVSGGVFSNSANTGSGNASVDLSSYMSANTRIQFIVTGTGGGDRLYVDNVQVSYQTNNAPAITSNGGGATASISVAENTTTVTTVAATDADTSQTLTYSISGGADAAKFSINSSTGALSFASAPNYESPTDSGGNNVYDVTVQVSDGQGGVDSQAISVTVTNVANEAPINMVPGAQTTLEDTNLVFSSTNGNQIAITDPDGSSGTYEVTLSVTNGSLSLSGVSGLTFTSGDGTGDSTMTLRGTVADINTALNGLSFAPTSDSSGSATLTLATRDSTLVSLDIDSNLQARYTFQGNTNDMAPGTAQNGTLTGGASIVTDATRGQVVQLDGVNDSVVINSTYGNPSNVTLAGWVNLDALEANVRLFSIGESAGISLDYSSVGVSGFFQDGTGFQRTNSNVSIAGTGWHHIAYAINDAENTQTIYIDGIARSTTTFTGSIDYTGATQTFIGQKADGNSTAFMAGKVDDARIYNRALSASEISALASDLSLTDTDTVAITVNAVNDGPSFTSLNGTPTFTEGGSAVVLDSTVTITDTELTAANNFNGATLTLSRHGGASSQDVFSGSGTLSLSGGNVVVAGTTIGTYTNSGGTLAMTFNSNATNTLVNSAMQQIAYSNSSDAPPSSVQVNWTFSDSNSGSQGSGGALTATGSVTVSITAVNDAPTDLSLSANSVAENALNGTVVGTISGTDPDSGDTKTYSLTDSAGGRFAINSSTGQITVANGSLLNYEAATSHTVTVRVTDSGGLTYDEAFTINLTNINEAPTGADATITINEDTPHTFTTTNFGFSDVDAGDSLSAVRIDSLPSAGTLTLSGVAVTAGQVVSLANITAGNLVFTPAVNATGSGYASLTFSVRDSSSAYDTAPNTLTVDVTAVNDAPTDLSLSANTVAENASNGTVVGTVSGTDPDSSDTKTYSFTDTAGGRFAINSSTGQITVADSSLLNYESATSHTVTVRVTDSGGLTYDETFTINLTNVNETPTDLSLSANTVAENAANGTVIGTVSGTDVDSGDTKTYSFTDSAGGRFAINSTTGQITVANGSLLDYEAATSHSVIVRVTDSGGLTYDETFTINLTNVNEAPTGADATVTITEDSSHTFTSANFGFSDVDAGDSLSAVRINTLPGAGSLTLAGVAVTAGQVVTVADITAGNLVFTPAANATGTGYASLTFSVRDSGNVYDAAPNTLTIDVTAVNDAPILNTNEGATVDEGASIILSAKNLEVVDVDNGASQVLYTITSLPINGTILLKGTPLSVKDTFTQDDIDSGIIEYQHDGSETDSDSFAFVVDDGAGGSLEESTFKIAVTPVNEAPTDLSLSANTVAENAANGTVVGTVSGTDSDTSDTKTYTLTDTASGRFAINSSTGQITVANGSLLDYESTTSHSVTVRVTDSGGQTYDETFTITLTNVNEAPTGADATVTISEDTSHTLTTTNFGFSDVDAGDSLSAVRIDTVPSAGTLTLSGVNVTAGQVIAVADITAGNLLFTPAADATGTGYANFTFSVRDSNKAYDTTPNTLTIDVTAQNDAPVNAVPGAQSVAEDTPLALSGISVNDVDGNLSTVQLGVLSGTLNVTLSGGATISAGNNGANTLTLSGNQADINATLATLVYQGALNYTGADTLTVTSTDMNSGTDVDTVALTVTAVNDVTVVTGGTSGSGTEDTTITGTLTATDTEGLSDGSVFSVTGAATQGTASIDPATGLWSYTPTADWNGSDSFTVTITDDAGNTTTQVISVTVTPVVDLTNDSLTTAEDTVISANVLTGTNGATADSFEGTPVLTSVTQGANGTVTFLANGTVTYTPNANFNGTDSFTYTITSGGVTETATVTVTVTAVNDPTVVTGGTSGSGTEDTTITGTLTATDAEGLSDGSVFSVTGAATQGTASIDPATGLWSYTPTADWNGTDSFTVTITDDAGNTATQVISVAVTPVVDMTNDSLTTNEDSAISANVLTGTNGATADSFEGTPVLTSVTQGANGSVTYLANGTVTYTPTANFTGTDSFTYTITSGGVTETATVTVTVNAVNDPTVVTGGTSGSGTEDTTLTGTLTATDVEGLSDGTVFTVSANATNGTASINPATGLWSYTPTADWNGTDSFTVTITDDAGNTATQLISVTVTPVVDLTNDSLTTNEDSAISANVLTGTNGATADSFEGTPVLTSVTQGANGSVTYLANGTVTYTPTANFTGTDSFTYTITSGGVTETATVTVTVNAVNDPTVVTGGTSGTGNEDTTLTGTLTATDAEGLTDGTVFTVSANATNGTASIDPATGLWSYTPNADWNGSDSFTVTITDDAGNTATQVISVTVTPVNDAPLLVANTGSTVAEGGTDTIDASELAVTDVEQTSVQLTYTIGTGPLYGRLELTTAPGVSATSFTQADIAANRLIYIHDGSESASDSFTFTVNDGAGGSLGLTAVMLAITPVNDTPTITSGGGGASTSINVAENVTGVTIVTGEDVDLPAQALSYSISGGVDQALFTINAGTGALSFTAPPDFEVVTDANGDNVYVVQVQVVDSQGASTTQTIQVTVTDVVESVAPPPVVPPILLTPTPPPPSGGSTAGPRTPPADEQATASDPTTVPPGPTVPPMVGPPVNVVPLTLVPPSDRPVERVPEEPRKTEEDAKDRPLFLVNDDQGHPLYSVLPVEPAPTLEPEPPETTPSVSDLLMAKLDEMAVSLEQAVSQSQERHELMARVAAVTGTTLSVGFVAWALRSGAILASCLATMPAWRHFDPLPVVKLGRNERRHRRDETTRAQQQEAAEFKGLTQVIDKTPALKRTA